MSIVYDIRGITKTYPGQQQSANKNITLQIREGEIFGLLGDNGAGKSTLVKQMMNLLASDSGEITLFGQAIDADPLFAPLHVGYMPQSGNALNSLTVGEALYFTAHLRGLSRSAARAERDRLLSLWDLQDIRHKPPDKLSGGQKRLLQLAVAMAGSPPVLILDEPTNDLAPQRRKRVWDVLRTLNREQGVTVIFITHDAVEAEKIIQRVGIMRAGELVALGRPSDLKKRVVQQLRLELFFPPESPPTLPDDLVPLRLDAGRWLVYVDRSRFDKSRAGEVLDLLDLEHIDDFSLHSATLEDLYLYFVGASRPADRETSKPGNPVDH